MERDYSSGKIYKLYIPGFDEFCYVGSTTESLSTRFWHHRSSANNPNQNKTAACQMFEAEVEPIIELIENFPCDSKQSLETRERYWIEQFPNCININKPTQTWQERWKGNRDHHLAKHKEWLKNNAEHVKEYNQQHLPIALAKEKERIAKAKADPKTREEYLRKRREIKNREKNCPKCGFKTTAGRFYLHSKDCK